MRHRVFGTVYGILGGLILLSVAAFAQDLNPGKLKITVHPEQAYTFVDGKRSVPTTGRSSWMSEPTIWL